MCIRPRSVTLNHMQADVLAAARERFKQAGKAGMSVERLPSGGLLDEVQKTGSSTPSVGHERPGRGGQ